MADLQIYCCWRQSAAVDPRRAAGSLTDKEWRAVLRASRAILTRAIQDRGTTMRDWRDIFGEPGDYQNERRVYGREGEPCPRCGAAVARVCLQGRGTYFCPACQG